MKGYITVTMNDNSIDIEFSNNVPTSLAADIVRLLNPKNRQITLDATEFNKIVKFGIKLNTDILGEKE